LQILDTKNRYSIVYSIFENKVVNFFFGKNKVVNYIVEVMYTFENIFPVDAYVHFGWMKKK